MPFLTMRERHRCCLTTRYLAAHYPSQFLRFRLIANADVSIRAYRDVIFEDWDYDPEAHMIKSQQQFHSVKYLKVSSMQYGRGRALLEHFLNVGIQDFTSICEFTLVLKDHVSTTSVFRLNKYALSQLTRLHTCTLDVNEHLKLEENMLPSTLRKLYLHGNISLCWLPPKLHALEVSSQSSHLFYYLTSFPSRLEHFVCVGTFNDLKKLPASSLTFLSLQNMTMIGAQDYSRFSRMAALDIRHHIVDIQFPPKLETFTCHSIFTRLFTTLPRTLRDLRLLGPFDTQPDLDLQHLPNLTSLTFQNHGNRCPCTLGPNLTRLDTTGAQLNNVTFNLHHVTHLVCYGLPLELGMGEHIPNMAVSFLKMAVSLVDFYIDHTNVVYMHLITSGLLGHAIVCDDPNFKPNVVDPNVLYWNRDSPQLYFRFPRFTRESTKESHFHLQYTCVYCRLISFVDLTQPIHCCQECKGAMCMNCRDERRCKKRWTDWCDISSE